MEENNQVIVDVQMDALIASLQELRKQYEANAAAINALDKESDTYEQDVIALTQENKVLQQEMRGVEKQIQNEIKAQKSQEDSLVQLRAKLANLNKQYDSMSGFDRMGTEGIKLQERIKGLSDQILNLEGNTGRWQRNVGNYTSALQGLSGNFKAAGLSTKGLDQSLKLLNGNPIVLLLTAIVTVARNIIKAFKGNEEATMALRQAFSAFNPIIDKGKRALEAFANVVVKMVTGAINGLTSSIGWLLDKVQAVGNFFGKDWHMGDNFREGVAAAKDLQAAENDYIKAKRAWSVESARMDREVADLREKAADKEKYTNKERLDFLDQAIALETKKAEKDKELAEQNLRNLQSEAERSANDAAMNDKLAEAERAVIEADTRLSDTKRSLNMERQEAIRGVNGETAATKGYTKAVDELRQALEGIRILSIDEAIKEQTKKNKELAENISEVTDRVGLLQDAIGPETIPVRETITVDDSDVQDSTTNLERFAEAYRDNADKIESVSSSLQSSFGSVASIYEQMAEDESKTEEEREAAAKKAKVWAALQIAANAGTALAKGIASAVDVGFPAAIPAMAAMTASILAAIAQAKALAAESHEHGGVIGGKFIGATMGKDNTYISARNGEMVLNANQQRQLFNIANGSVGTNMAAELAAAIREMPAPVLEYSEFQQFAGRVITLNETQKLR